MSFDQVRLVRVGQKPGWIDINRDIFLLDIVRGRLCGRSARDIVLSRRHFNEYQRPWSKDESREMIQEERGDSKIRTSGVLPKPRVCQPRVPVVSGVWALWDRD